MADRDEYLDTQEAAPYAGFGVSTLEKKRLTGDGPPFIKVGRKVLYRRRDLDAWLARHVRHSTAECA